MRNAYGRSNLRADSQPRSPDPFNKIRGQRRFEKIPLAIAWMTETKFPRMQHLAREIFCKPRRIDFIAEHGMAEMMEMHPNLMSAPAAQPAFN